MACGLALEPSQVEKVDVLIHERCVFVVISPFVAMHGTPGLSCVPPPRDPRP